MGKHCKRCRGSWDIHCARRAITAIINAECNAVGAGVGVESDFAHSHASGKDAWHCCSFGTPADAEAN